MKKKITDIIITLGITYPYGIISGIVFKIMQFLGIIRISHLERFPVSQGKIILISNHPCMVDPFLLTPLFSKQYFFHPFRYHPWNVCDKKIFYDPWYWFWLRPVLIPVDRGSKKAELRAFLHIKRVLEDNGIIILFPEGGRTFRGRKNQNTKRRSWLVSCKNWSFGCSYMD